MSKYKEIIIPKGSTFNNAIIKGWGNVSFKESPKNDFDSGFRTAELGTYKVLSVVDRSNEDTAPFLKSIDINGYSVKIGTVVNIELIKDVTAKIPTEQIIYNQRWDNNTGSWGNNTQPPNNSMMNQITSPKKLFPWKLILSIAIPVIIIVSVIVSRKNQ